MFELKDDLQGAFWGRRLERGTCSLLVERMKVWSRPGVSCRTTPHPPPSANDSLACVILVLQAAITVLKDYSNTLHNPSDMARTSPAWQGASASPLLRNLHLNGVLKCDTLRSGPKVYSHLPLGGLSPLHTLEVILHDGPHSGTSPSEGLGWWRPLVCQGSFYTLGLSVKTECAAFYSVGVWTLKPWRCHPVLPLYKMSICFPPPVSSPCHSSSQALRNCSNSS